MNKNICHICSNFDSFFVDFMNEQKKQDLEFRIFYFRGKERGVPDIEAPNLDIRLNHRQWMRYFFFLKEKAVYRDFQNIYKDEKFDIVHAHTLFSNGYIAYKNFKKNKTPYIVSVRDTDLNVFFKYRFYLRSLGRKILLNAEKIIFISKNYEINLIENYLSENEKQIVLSKSEVIPNGITEFFYENQLKNRSLDKTKKELTIITVGYIMKRKNQLLVCEALDQLEQEGFSINYLIVGKILDDDYYKKIERYKFVEHINYVDKEKLIELYRLSDVFVMPSITETFGLTYIEALSQKLPIIYSKGQGIDSYFQPGEIGEAVDSNKSEDISNKIKKIVNDYESYVLGMEDSINDFRWEKIVKKYDFIYTEILEDR